MGRSSIGVSGYALTVSRAIRAQIGIRRINQSELARLIDRSDTYVRDRINDRKEWALGDLERMCKLWNLQPSQLIEGVPQSSESEPAQAEGPDFLSMAAKHGDTEAEQEAYEEMP